MSAYISTHETHETHAGPLVDVAPTAGADIDAKLFGVNAMGEGARPAEVVETEGLEDPCCPSVTLAITDHVASSTTSEASWTI